MMKRVVLFFLILLSLFTFYPLHSFALPAEDVQLVVDAQYFETAKKMIQEAKSSIHVMMYEMVYYDQYPNSPSNLLIKELIEAKKRGVKVEIILEVKEEEDKTTLRNRQTGKMLTAGNVEVIYDPSFKTTHAKLIITDGELSILGSTNWTYHGLTSNNEVSALIRSKGLAKELIDYFNRVKATGNKK